MSVHRAPILFGLSLLAGCSPDWTPLDAGQRPEGGGTVDTRLAGCEWTWRIEYLEDGRVQTNAVSYDDEGRVVRDEWVIEGELPYVTETTYDADGCPASGTVTDAAGLHEDIPRTEPWTQECDAHGYVTRYTYETEDLRYTNVYDASGRLAEIQSDWNGDGRFETTNVLAWQDDRLVEFVTLRATSLGELPSFDRAYTYRDDGWIETIGYPDSTEVQATYAYDGAGRVVAIDDTVSPDTRFTYANPDDTFPSGGEWVDTAALTFTVSCP